MISKDNIKAVSCFNLDEYENSFIKQTIEFKVNDNLNYCTNILYQYGTLKTEVAQTISNTPWGTIPFQFAMNVLRPTDDIQAMAGSIIQIIPLDGEWRRCFFSNSLEGWWGKWINIENIIDFIYNANENIKKKLTESWDRYMVIDKNNIKNRRWVGNVTTIDRIIEEIKTGTAKIYRNKLI